MLVFLRGDDIISKMKELPKPSTPWGFGGLDLFCGFPFILEPQTTVYKLLLQLDDEPNLYIGNGWKSPFPSIYKWLALGFPL